MLRFTTCLGASPVVLRGDELLHLGRLSRLLVEDPAAGPLESLGGPVGANDGVLLSPRVLEEVLELLGSGVNRNGDGALAVSAVLDGLRREELLERSLEDDARRAGGIHEVEALAAELVLLGLVGLRGACGGKQLCLAVQPGLFGLLLLEAGLSNRAEATADNVGRLVGHGSFSLSSYEDDRGVQWVKGRNPSYF